MRHWQVLVLLVAALATLFLYVLEGDSEPASLSPSLVERSSAEERRAELAPPSDALERLTASEPDAVTLEPVRRGAPELTSEVVAELAALLDTEELDRAIWSRAASALASSLERSGSKELNALLRQAELDQRECIAAAELLRVLSITEVGDHASPLDLATIRRLRVAQADARHPAETLAATRVLAGAGEFVDALQLADELLWSDELQRRVDAGWCLATSRRPMVAQYLASNLASLEEVERLERALATLVDMGSDQLDVLLDDLARMQLVQAVELAIESVGTERARALSHYLSQLDSEGASAHLLGQLDSVADLQLTRDLSRLLVKTADESATRELAARFEMESDPARRLALAEALLPSASAGDEPIREEAFRVVSESALRSQAAVDRRRGVLVLGAVHEPRSAEVLLEVLRADPDARVRSAAAHALSNLPTVLLTPLREVFGTLDDSSVNVSRALDRLRRRAEPIE